MFRKKGNSEFSVENNFFLPLECEYPSHGSETSKKKLSVVKNMNFFPLNDTSYSSHNNFVNDKNNQSSYGSIKIVGNSCSTHSAPVKLNKMGERRWDSIHNDSIFNSNCHPNNRNDSAPYHENIPNKNYHDIAESETSRINKNFDTPRPNTASFVLNIADEDVIEFNIDSKTPCIDILSGVTLEKCSLTLNEINKKLFNTLYDFQVSRYNPEENLIELILPNCVELLHLFEEIEILTSSCDEVFERSTFINTIEFIVHDIWVETLTRNLCLFHMLDANLKWCRDKYIICKLKSQFPSTNIMEILGNLKHFPNSILETFEFGIKLKGQDQCNNSSAIMDYVVFNRTFCTIALEIKKCFIMIVKFMHSVDLLQKFSNEIFLAFIEILIKIVFEHQVPQLFLGIDEIFKLWLKNDGMERRKLLDAWCNAIVRDLKQNQASGILNEESESITSSIEDDEDSLQFNKWDVIDPFIENIKALQKPKPCT